MRILLLTQWFDPEPTFKGLLFAKALQAKGHSVEVITGFPNYPGGKVYSGYRIKCLQREVIDGVKITRVPLYPDHGSSAFGRILNYISFAFSSSFYGIFMARKADVIYAYHPTPMTGFSAALISFFRRIPFVYDIQDMWPDTLRATGFINSSRLLKCIDKFCKWIYRRAAHIVVLSPGFKSLLIERGVSAEKIDVIYNWCDEQALAGHQPNFHAIADMAGYINIVFAGNMGRAQALESILLAAKHVAAMNAKVRFVFVGGGIDLDSLKQKSKDWHMENVVFIPRLPMNEVGAVLMAADVLLVHLKDEPLFSITIPSKTQAYMAIGRPILMAVKGDAADLITKANAGSVAIPEDPHSIATAVLKMASMPSSELLEMGNNAKSYYREHLSLEAGVQKFLAIFEKVSK